MKKIKFYKLQASGNDFILLDQRGKRRISYSSLAKRMCKRKEGIGGDGLLVIESSKMVSFKMRIFNPDGSEAQMCGNGARCVAMWAKIFVPSLSSKQRRNYWEFETQAGLIKAEVKPPWVRINLSKPYDFKEDVPLKLWGKRIRVNFINTGVPHSIIFVEGLEKIDIEKIGRAIRFHKKFAPQGTNVDFVEWVSPHFIKVRTYERGVEKETLACGTGIVASAIISHLKFFSQEGRQKIKVTTQGGEILRVYFTQEGEDIREVSLEGKAYLVYQGIYEN